MDHEVDFSRQLEDELDRLLSSAERCLCKIEERVECLRSLVEAHGGRISARLRSFVRSAERGMGGRRSYLN